MKNQIRPVLGVLLLTLLPGLALHSQTDPVSGLRTVDYDHHIELFWNQDPNPAVQGYRIYGTVADGEFEYLGYRNNVQTSFIHFLGDQDLTGRYYVRSVANGGQLSPPSDTVTGTTYAMSDSALLDMVQAYTFRYFWDFAHPVSGLARERSSTATVTSGGSGFGIMAIIVGAERGFVTYEQALQRTTKIVDFLHAMPKFRGAFPHWLNGATGQVIPFSALDNGGDLVETAFLIQDLLTASDNPDGYLAHSPESAARDNGTITPTAALGSMPYTPDQSMTALKHFYRELGDRLWGEYGFYDAFNLGRNWFASSYLGIDQGPIILPTGLDGGYYLLRISGRGAAGASYNRIVFFFNAGNTTEGDELYYFDNLQLNRAPFRDDCLSDFESPESTIPEWRNFSNGALEGSAFVISDNPAPNAVNSSAKVGTFEEANDGLQFAGLAGTPSLPVLMAAGAKTMTMKVWMPVAGDVVFKLEPPQGDVPESGDIFATYDTPGEWQELTWDFSTTAGGAEIPDGALYNVITLIPNFGVIPDENLTHYFDDIVVGGGSCITTGIFEPVRVDELRVFPNPAYDRLTIENNDRATTFRITNLLEQTFETVRTDSARERLDLDLSRPPRGMYILTAYDEAGQLAAKANFVKQ